MRRPLTSCAALIALCACRSPAPPTTPPEADATPTRTRTATRAAPLPRTASVAPPIDRQAAERCREALADALPAIESAPKTGRVPLALRALAACEALPSELRDAARDSAELNVDRRRVRLHAAIPRACRSPSAFDHGPRLPDGCAPTHVSKSLIRNVDAPTCAFAAQVRRQLARAHVLDGPAKRVVDNLLLGAAASSGR